MGIGSMVTILQGEVCQAKASSESAAHLMRLAVDGCTSHSVHDMHGQCNGVGVQIFSEEPLRGPRGHKHGTGVQVFDLQTFVAQDLQPAYNIVGLCMVVVRYAWSMLWLMRVYMLLSSLKAHVHKCAEQEGSQKRAQDVKLAKDVAKTTWNAAS